MRRGHRVPTPVLVLGTGAALVGLIATLTFVEPARSSPQDRCSRFAQDSRSLAGTPVGNGRTVAVIGDSYAAGRYLPDPTTAWTQQLRGRVQTFAFSGSGFTRSASSCGSVSFFERVGEALAGDPDLVVVEGGLNDGSRPEPEIRAGYRALLESLGDRPVLVVGPPPAPSRTPGARRVDRILASEARRSDTPYLSMIGRRLRYLDDGVHLTAEGHRTFGTVVARRAERLGR